MPFGQNDNIADEKQLRSKADNYVNEFIGNDAANFKYKNSEKEFQVIRGTPERLVSITFRYVRILDGREILGITNHLRIKLAQDGTVRFLDFTNPVLVKTQEISSKIKLRSFGKYLDSYLNSNDFLKTEEGIPIPIKSVEVNDASSSYFAVKVGENEYLSPHTSFQSTIVFGDGGTGRREFHLTIDPERIPGVPADDINKKISQEAVLSLRAEDWDNLNDADVKVVNRSNSTLRGFTGRW